MNYIELELNGEVYKLRLNTRAVVGLEKTLGNNPVKILMDLDEGELPKMSDIVIMFHSMLQAYQHGINLDRAYDLFDAYTANGKTVFDFIPEVIVPVFQNCGLLAKEVSEEKN
jgi:hypothetical protein